MWPRLGFANVANARDGPRPPYLCRASLATLLADDLLPTDDPEPDCSVDRVDAAVEGFRDALAPLPEPVDPVAPPVDPMLSAASLEAHSAK
mmetsp:Transcript_10208/g.38688  ORF Transcript_10208/g.38688 Transcript_10208/m.38688 type:complete len:91 (-) Transcript_10208:1235-1507(-)